MNNDVSSVDKAINSIEHNDRISEQFKGITYNIIKRLFDIVASLFGLLLLIPISLIIKVCYVLNGDFAPILFSQKRIGLDGKEFKFYKFRSMVPDADEVLRKL